LRPVTTVDAHCAVGVGLGGFGDGIGDGIGDGTGLGVGFGAGPGVGVGAGVGAGIGGNGAGVDAIDAGSREAIDSRGDGATR
jgi:hypothetical protein